MIVLKVIYKKVKSIYIYIYIRYKHHVLNYSGHSSICASHDHSGMKVCLSPSPAEGGIGPLYSINMLNGFLLSKSSGFVMTERHFGTALTLLVCKYGH